MKTFLSLISLCIGLHFSSLAQTGTTLTGHIVNEQEEDLPQANVRLLRLPDSTVMKMINSDAKGQFQFKGIPSGQYLLQMHYLGLLPAKSSAFDVDSTFAQLDLGKFIMQAGTTELEEIVLIAQPQPVRYSDGKMVVQVGSSAMKTGSSVLDMIATSPGVSLDQNGTLQLNGKSGVQVLINGRSTYLKGADLQSFLSSLPAQELEKIEISNHPSAHQDADGMAGVINMVFKKNVQQGFYGTAHAGYSYRKLHFLSGGTQMNYVNDKWSFSLQGQTNDRGQIRNQDSQRLFTGQNRALHLTQLGIDQRKGRHSNAQADVVYQWNPRQSIGVSTHAIFNRIGRDWETISQFNDQILQETTGLEALNIYKDNSNNQLASLFYRGQLDTLGSFLHVDLDYVGLQRTNNATFDNAYLRPGSVTKEIEKLRSLSTSDYTIWAGKFDYRKQWRPQQSLQIGAKISQIGFDSQLDFGQMEANLFNTTPGRKEAFAYTESILALYAQYKQAWGDRWTLEAGLRGENTDTERQSLLDTQPISQNYWHFFPSVSVQQKVSDQYALTYAFAKSIARTPFELLNPYVFYVDPYSYVIGSPDLKPQLATTFQVTQQLYNKYILTLSYDKTDHFIGEVFQMDAETKETIYRMANLKNFISYGMTAYAPVRFLSGWSSANTLTLQQQQYHMDFGAGTQMRNKQLFALFQSNHTFTLPYNSTLEVNATWKGPTIYGYYRVKSQWWVDAAIKTKVNAQWDVSVKSMDIFRSMQMYVKSSYNGNTNNINQYFGNQTIGFSVHYKFGNQKAAKSTPKSSSLEELNRLNP